MVGVPDIGRERRLQSSCDLGSVRFAWSQRKIRIAALVLAGAATLVAAGVPTSNSYVKWLCLCALMGLALAAHGLGRRAFANAAILCVDRRGILDRRLMPRHIEWQEIESVCRVESDRSKVVDIKLRWPKKTLAGTRWPIRIGAYCQAGYGVPAVTISMWLLEGEVSALLDAVARYRPDLLHRANRRCTVDPSL